MALLSIQKPKITGTAVTFASASGGGDTIPYSGRGVVLVNNTDASSHTVTVVIPGNTPYGQPQPDVAVAVPAGEYRAIGPFPPGAATDGLVSLTYSSATGMKVAYLAQ